MYRPTTSGPAYTRVATTTSGIVPGTNGSIITSNTRRLLQPRLLIFALVALTLLATYLSYTLLMGEDDVWKPVIPFSIDTSTTNTNTPAPWTVRPDTTRPSVTGSYGDTKSTRTTLGIDSMSVYTQCHNTIQGRKLVTDDSGAICARQNVLRNGCCHSAYTIDRMSCGMCRTDVQCCRSYEYCVSCCLSKLPDTDRASDSIADGTVAPRVSFHSFDKCLHLCRTSSRSIKHGNVYRTPVLRHCYTEGEHALPIRFEESATVLVAKQGVSCSRACTSYRGPKKSTSEDGTTSSGSSSELDDLDTPSVVLPPPASPPLYICHEAFLPLINTCSTMLQHFQCHDNKCDTNAGNDQPALVVNDTPSPDTLKQPVTNRTHLPRGQCLLNGDEKLFDCEGHHESTRRLCVCIEADRAE